MVIIKTEQWYLQYEEGGTALHITQHKMFVPHGTHPNSSLTLRTSFMLGTLYLIGLQRIRNWIR